MIVDTNALSALAGKDAAILDRLREVRRLAVPLISLGEFKYGIARSRAHADLEAWLTAFLQRAEVLVPDLETAAQYAVVRSELQAAGTPIPANDCWIAAIVRQHGLPILSRDRHFDHVDRIRRIAW